MKNEFLKYRDMLDMPRPQSRKRTPMSSHDRAAQFSPFAALVGHEGAVEECARLTESKTELDEHEKSRIADAINLLVEYIDKMPEIKVKYFCPDMHKEGGCYKSFCGRLIRVDELERSLVFENRTRIFVEDITEIESSALDFVESV